jgi:hypothetical protein
LEECRLHFDDIIAMKGDELAAAEECLPNQQILMISAKSATKSLVF